MLISFYDVVMDLSRRTLQETFGSMCMMKYAVATHKTVNIVVDR
jgi:hypothetical protein